MEHIIIGDHFSQVDNITFHHSSSNFGQLDVVSLQTASKLHLPEESVLNPLNVPNGPFVSWVPHLAR